MRKFWSITYLLIAVLFTITSLYVIWSRPDVARAKKVAADMRAVIQRDPRFREVYIEASSNAVISVCGDAKFSPESKVALERLVSEHANGFQTSVLYLVPASEDTGR
jgi:hypothetical protein